MTPYLIEVKASARKALERLPPRVQDQIKDAMAGLATEPRPIGVEKMTGEIDLYRVRVGRYRVVYDIDDGGRAVTVTAIGHRSIIYRHFSLILFVLR